MMFNNMMRAEIWLQDRLASQQGIEDLAERLGYSSSQIRRNFKRCFGVSPSTYRDRLRLDKAALLLSYTQLGINEIALQCGYRNHSAFSRAFLRNYRISPREFRKAEKLKLEIRRRTMEHDYHVRIGHAKDQQTVVTRFYSTQAARNTALDFLDHEALEALPERLRDESPIAIVHGNPLTADFTCADLGVQIKADIADELAPPLPFRSLGLPAYRYASVTVDDLSELGDTLTFLLAKALPERGEFASGLPLKLLWPNGNARQRHKRKSGIEVRLPLSGERDNTTPAPYSPLADRTDRRSSKI
ncbi:helix-turn-helix transcriptional regulator [Litchfieldella rifensis]|uniref:Helix-turn-helix transcriptional regulator n=1 Tax=Litchfieldella rifensis TaxID=762643 RepID=A0ABV7LL02_9GAMM